MRLRTNARVTATGPKKSKMQVLIERHGLHYAKHLKDTMEAYNTKTESIAFRKQILDSQKKHNYQSEFEKVRGILAQSTQPFKTLERLRNRQAELKALGATAITMN